MEVLSITSYSEWIKKTQTLKHVPARWQVSLKQHYLETEHPSSNRHGHLRATQDRSDCPISSAVEVVPKVVSGLFRANNRAPQHFAHNFAHDYQ